MSTPAAQEPESPVMARATAPGPRPAVLTVENEETRVLREKVETFEAQDQHRIEADLKMYSGIFNERIQALEAENNAPKGEPTSSGNPNDAFAGMGARNPAPSGPFIRPINAPTTPNRPPLPHRPPQQQVIFALAAPLAAPPAPPPFPPGPRPPQPPPMGPFGFPPACGMAAPSQGPQIPWQVSHPPRSFHPATRGRGHRGRGHGHNTGRGGFHPNHPNHAPSFRPGPAPGPAVPGFPPGATAVPAFNPGFARGPISAPIAIGPFPGRPAVLVWHPPAPGQGGMWVALPRDPERKRFVPRPVGDSVEAMVERGSPLERGQRAQRRVVRV